MLWFIEASDRPVSIFKTYHLYLSVSMFVYVCTGQKGQCCKIVWFGDTLDTTTRTYVSALRENKRLWLWPSYAVCTYALQGLLFSYSLWNWISFGSESDPVADPCIFPTPWSVVLLGVFVCSAGMSIRQPVRVLPVYLPLSPSLAPSVFSLPNAELPSHALPRPLCSSPPTWIWGRINGCGRTPTDTHTQTHTQGRAHKHYTAPSLTLTQKAKQLDPC